MPMSIRNHYAATPAGLRAALAGVVRNAARMGFAQVTQAKLRLVVEELYTNTLRHSAATSATRVRVRLQRTSRSRVCLRFEDEGAAYDPFAPAHLAALGAALQLPVEDRPVGQLGIVLIEGLAHSVTYARVAGCNRIDVVIAAATAVAAGCNDPPAAGTPEAGTPAAGTPAAGTPALEPRHDGPHSSNGS